MSNVKAGISSESKPSLEPSVESKDPYDWNPSEINDLLSSQDFSRLVSNECLYRFFDTERSMEVVDWCKTHGYNEGHVPVLYMYLRNLIKWESGRVMTDRDFQHALECVVFLLLRTLQDVTVCSRLFAMEDAKKCYAILRSKINGWLIKFMGHKWPSLRLIVTKLSNSLPSFNTYPSPVWSTQCSTAMMSSSTIYFSTPTPSLMRSARENESKVNEVRQEVAQKFFDWSKERTWKEFLNQDYTDSCP